MSLPLIRITQDVSSLREREYDSDILLDANSKARCIGGPTTMSTELNDAHTPRLRREPLRPSHQEATTWVADAPPRPDPSRIWAILIGIDGYASYPLHGCVADALAVKQYLVEDLLVSQERIQSLLGPMNHHDTSPTEISSIPSRENILSVLLSLITNSDIECGDPIIIFFAGHGSRYALSDYDNDEDYDCDDELDDGCSHKFIEALCPIDRNTFDSRGMLIPDISDRELNNILSQISRIKGHRITFILDCCHAGSVTRTLSSMARTAPPLEHTSLKGMLLQAARTPNNLPGHQSISGEDWVPDMNSHVIIAACRENEVAKGRRAKGTKVWRGVFTSSLIETLKTGALGEGATYVDLIKALPQLRYQTPIVAGEHINTCLWYQH
ncbi:caspase domain-containing protein [Armillaria novae-zelandiae]|uniref:Caspase domain-containing protein n=1 Tax=Armillaria novae-zelandiae TaxID=153914 RepID=A0AA39PJX3_9AGAR|nr:caspase domain-containing protein [Armillaria novae-zelandiae]